MWLLIAKIESPAIYIPRTKREMVCLFSQNYKGNKRLEQVKKVNASLGVEGKNKIMSVRRRRDKYHYSHLE